MAFSFLEYLFRFKDIDDYANKESDDVLRFAPKIVTY